MTDEDVWLCRLQRSLEPTYSWLAVWPDLTEDVLKNADYWLQSLFSLNQTERLSTLASSQSISPPPISATTLSSLHLSHIQAINHHSHTIFHCWCELAISCLASLISTKMPHTGSMGFQALILCGPGGSLNTFTSRPEEYPKCLIQVANRPMIFYAIDFCRRSGITGMSMLSLANPSIHHSLNPHV